MTSLAFILGVLPLAIASGAGSAAQRAVGTGVMGGMIASTSVGLCFVPLLFYVVMRIFGYREKSEAAATAAAASSRPGA